METPTGGRLLIADVDFSVSVMHMSTIRVAAISLFETPNSEAPPVSAWKEVVHAVEKRSVRIIAGEFADRLPTALDRLREKMSVRAAALVPCLRQEDNTRWLASSAMVMVGPVGESQDTILHDGKGNIVWSEPSETRGRGASIKKGGLLKLARSLEDQPFTGKAGEDETRGWPEIQSVKQKKVERNYPHTKKLSIFAGARDSRRSAKASARRREWYQEQDAKRKQDFRSCWR